MTRPPEGVPSGTCGVRERLPIPLPLPEHGGVETAQTRAVRERYGVPRAIQLRIDGRAVMAFLPAHQLGARQVAREPDSLPLAGVGGRAPLYVVLSGVDRVLVRPYRKGGVLRHVRGARFQGRWRPLVELVLHHHLQGLDVPVVEAVGAVVLRSPAGWRGFLLTREVPGAMDLEAWLHGAPSVTDVDRETVLRRAGEAVRRLHDAGVSHADLHAKNLLLTPEGEIRILDLDRARVYGKSVPEAARLNNLVRFGLVRLARQLH